MMVWGIPETKAIMSPPHPTASKLKRKTPSHAPFIKSIASDKRGIKGKKLSLPQPKYAAIVIDAETGTVLHEEEADGIRHPASLTKMMTLYMLFEALKSGKVALNSSISVSEKAARQPPSKLDLKPGHTMTVRTAILGLVIKSANNAAVAVAEHLGGSEEVFAYKMTLKARALGMRNTIFKNASGLPNPLQVTTARDMAILSRALYRDFPKEYKYFATQCFSHKGQIHRNHNHLLGKVAGVDGIKTGWIVASGSNLSASAQRYDAQNKPHRLITVVLGGPNRHWRDRRVEELLESHFLQRGAYQASLNKNQQNRTPEGQASINDLVYEVNDEEIPIERIADSDAYEEEGLSESQEASQKSLPQNWVVPKLRKTPPNNPVQPSKFHRRKEQRSHPKTTTNRLFPGQKTDKMTQRSGKIKKHRKKANSLV
jgi:D-alanyl-D-alanine carboxypeptidase